MEGTFPAPSFQQVKRGAWSPRAICSSSGYYDLPLGLHGSASSLFDNIQESRERIFLDARTAYKRALASSKAGARIEAEPRSRVKAPPEKLFLASDNPVCSFSPEGLLVPWGVPSSRLFWPATPNLGLVAVFDSPALGPALAAPTLQPESVQFLNNVQMQSAMRHLFGSQQSALEAAVRGDDGVLEPLF